MAAPIRKLLGGKRGGRPQLGLRRQLKELGQIRSAWKLEASRHHTENRVRRAVQAHRLPANVGIAAKSFLPCLVADDYDVALARLILFFSVSTPQDRCYAHDSKEAC